LRKLILIGVALLAAGCGGDSITPKIATQLKAQRGKDGEIALTLSVKNETERPTVPLLVRVEVAGAPVIQPVAFVLNSKEEHVLKGSLNTKGAVAARITVKEAERGRMLADLTKEIPAAE
jgi:hypothetical protein